MSDQPSAQPEKKAVRPHGYTMADEEMERLEEKSRRDDVLDPIALNDPVGLSVEKIIGRAMLAVVLVLVVGILFAQVACKNIRLWGIPSFSAGVTSDTIEKAMSTGVNWGGDIVKFPDTHDYTYDNLTGIVTVTVKETSRQALTTLVDGAQSQAFALAMSLFESEDVHRVEYIVEAPIDEESGKYVDFESSDVVANVLTVIWERDSDGTLTCRLEGFDPLEKKLSGQE